MTSTAERVSHQNLRRIFDEIDVNHDGTLSIDECVVALQKAHLPCDVQDARKMRYAIRGERYEHGVSPTGRDITFDEFKKYYEDRCGKLAAHFDGLILNVRDTKRSEAPGSSTRRTLLLSHLRDAVTRDTGVAVDDATLTKVFDNIDLDGDGKVTLEEWLNALLLVPELQLDAFLDDLMHLGDYLAGGVANLSLKPAKEITSAKSDSPMYLLGKKIICGGAAGVISRFATAPLDRIRIVMMTTKPPLGMMAAIRHIATDGNPKTKFAVASSFWQGNGSNCVKVGFELAAKLNAHSKIVSVVTGEDPKKATMPQRLLAGGIAGFLGEWISHPVDVIRSRIAASPRGTYKGILHCAQTVFTQGGARGFYIGMVPSVLGIVPYAAIDLGANSFLRDQAREYMARHKQQKNFTLLFGCGMVSSCCATCATFPLYTMRTKMTATNSPLRQTFREMAAAGPRMWYAGVVPALAKVMPATSIGYAVYETLNARL